MIAFNFSTLLILIFIAIVVYIGYVLVVTKSTTGGNTKSTNVYKDEGIMDMALVEKAKEIKEQQPLEANKISQTISKSQLYASLIERRRKEQGQTASAENTAPAITNTEKEEENVGFSSDLMEELGVEFQKFRQVEKQVPEVKEKQPIITEKNNYEEYSQSAKDIINRVREQIRAIEE